jgi:CheY-like chemotaxis protein
VLSEAHSKECASPFVDLDPSPARRQTAERHAARGLPVEAKYRINPIYSALLFADPSIDACHRTIIHPQAQGRLQVQCSRQKEQEEEVLEPEIVSERGPRPVPASGKKGQLLVVDDDKAMQALLSRALSLMGHDVTLASNGLEAVSLLLTGSYDLVITDFRMPLMNGWELSRHVKDQSPNTPVIIITGVCDDQLREKLSMNRLDAIILKPFGLKEVETVVQRLLNS